MIDLKQKQLWFVTGSQHLYGEKVVHTVAENSRAIVDGLSRAQQIPLDLVWKPVLTGPDAILDTVHRGECVTRLRRVDPVDAHLFAR